MITLTENAAKHIQQQLSARGKGLGIRLGVKTTGCSGLAYILEFVDVVDEHDVQFTDFDTSVFIDPKSLVYLDGTQVDFVTKDFQSGFEFTNPNANGECGCGESFTV